MPLSRAFLQTLGAIVLLAMALACKGKSKGSSSTTVTPSVSISGTVTYKRVPLARDANGVPTGLKDAAIPANLTSLPARGVVIRAYQQLEQTKPDGTKILVWTIARSGVTDALGAYVLSVPKDRPTMVEVISSFTGGNSSQINLVAEPGGINSTTGALDRLRYALRKAADGTSPAGNNAPSWTVTADAVVDFSVGLNDVWWLVDPAFNLASSEAPLTNQAVLETSISGRTTGLGSGSRVLGIGDTIATFVTAYGAATPGTTLDLHYWPGHSEPRGSYIEYDRSLFPQAYDTSTGNFHYFGSIRGADVNDDAWDEGVILPMLGRNFLYGTNLGRTFSIPFNPLLPASSAQADLIPDMARIEGLADAMAANLLKSPYLADTQGTGLAAPVLDIRDISGLPPSQLTPYSAPAIRAFAWEIILKANSLPSPGTSADWATINPLVIPRFFRAPVSPTKAATDTTAARDLEPLSIYNQFDRLKEVKSASDPVDLSAIFTDAALTTLAAPFGITWPRPTTAPYAAFVSDWGTDPTTAFPPVTLSMAKAIQVNGSYPNLSQGEIFYTGFSLNADKRCTLAATISPALGAGAKIEVDMPGTLRTFSFTGSGGSTEVIVIPVANTAPYYHPLRLRLKSPATLQPDVVVTLALVPAP
ncbi:MAG: hypothetical protein HXX12_11125 [Geothrix sp.]|uniref:hypothetical protein n=1 Tax=Geothrix sp. TaxID=1962974 RepID=UPI0017B65DA4|nr:hypothetical protein [Geothrix sp.]NWJ41508.1 hypothetical protein [Geothrix sp.]WIL20507.1 MAG: hypothetical protein QOZ81_003078 [Geothrix sp.]